MVVTGERHCSCDGTIQQWVKAINQAENGEIHLHNKMEFVSTAMMPARNPQKSFFSFQKLIALYIHMGNILLISTFLKTLCNAIPFTNSWTLVQKYKHLIPMTKCDKTVSPSVLYCFKKMVLIPFLAFVCISQRSWHPTSQALVKDVSNYYNTAPPSRQLAYQTCLSGITT